MSATASQPSPDAVADMARGSEFSRRWSAPIAGLILAVLTVYLAFNAGGFFPGATAYATVVVAVLVVLGIMLVHEPLTGSPPALLAALGAICGFAALTLLSGSWSHSWSRAILEFDRALLYALVLVLFGLMPQREDGLEWGLRGFAAAAFTVCVIAWITRVEPNLWPISTDIRPQRLSFPLTYWNALGLLAALGSVALLHLTCGERQRKAVRVAAAAAMPLMFSTLLLTFSRSSLVVCALGVVLYLALARPKRAIAALLALAIPIAVALVLSVRAHTVSSARYALETSQGHHLALAVIACVVVAGLLRAAALLLDDRLDAWRPPRVNRARLGAITAAIVVVAVIVGLAAGGGSWLSHRWDHFVHENAVGHIEDPSERLSSVGNNGRIPQWRVAIDAFDEKPLLGKGAGTYAVQWLQHRPYDFTVLNAHSLYAEVMGELGIVGLLLIVVLMLAFLVGAARRMRGRDRQVYGAFLAMAVVWMVRAGVDWDWQMPAITLWLFALGGIAASRPLSARREVASSGAGRFPRLVGAVCVGVLAITPVVIALSQTHLEKAVRAFDANECPASISASLDSINALGVRPEPYELIGYCDARYGQYQLGEEAMESAISRDPENWETHYGLGLVQAASGKDPMPALREAKRLNPLEPLVRHAVAIFEKAKRPAERERLADKASLPL
ncbi:MAG TPA: O-antigen ligase family protein [Solirubrobacterales bacterium]|nr:O-antigen ligase family protein [Solirubrobacterales bacterium]